MIERVKTGIEGLDEVLSGGIPKGYAVFLTGGAGSGKTTFGMQFLAYGARNGEVGEYISFEEDPDQIVNDFSVFDPNVKELIEQNKLKVVSLPLSDLEGLKNDIRGELSAINASRVVIDSVSFLQIFFSDIVSYRKAIVELSRLFKSMGITSIFIGEIPFGSNSLSTTGVEEFATDGIITLLTIQKQDSFVRALRVVKMRGTRVLNKLCPYDFIEGKGIVVYPSAEVFAEM